MKKHLLSLLIVPFLFFGFSNSQLISTENITQEYTTSNYWIKSLTEWITYNLVNLNGWPLVYQPCANSSCSVRRSISISSSYVINSIDISPQLQCNWYSTCKFSVSYIQKNEIVPVSSLTPAINWLKDVVYEVIPYVVYIWIWLLLSIIWFYAVRWLVNWLWWKINSYFNSKRG